MNPCPHWVALSVPNRSQREYLPPIDYPQRA